MAGGRIKYKAMLSGFFSGTASCMAKYGLDPSSPLPSWVLQRCLDAHAAQAQEDLNDGSMDYTCIAISLLPRGMFLLIMLGLNLLMVASFMQGMNESGTVVATALGTGTNFSMSAVYGVLLFNEKLNTVWLFGFSLILLGVSMLASVTVKTVKTN